MNSSYPQKRRWRPRFSLKLVLIVVTLVSVLMGSFALQWRQARRQQRAAAAFHKAGAVLIYAYDIDDPSTHIMNVDIRPTAQSLPERLLGTDFFADILTVEAYQSRVDDSTLAQLKHLPKLEFLDLSATSVTDKGLLHVRETPELRYLGLDETAVTDKTLETLAGLPYLTILSLSETKVTDRGLEHLGALHSLTIVRLPRTVDGRGLSHLRAPLVELQLPAVSREGWREVIKFPGLRRLVVDGRSLVDKDMQALGSLKELKELHLYDAAQLTDASLHHFQSLGQLEEMIIRSVLITNNGVSDLRRALPKAEIRFQKILVADDAHFP